MQIDFSDLNDHMIPFFMHTCAARSTKLCALAIIAKFYGVIGRYPLNTRSCFKSQYSIKDMYQ